MPDSVEKPRICLDVTINVLGYQEDDAWVALALEMDLRGYGETFEDALNELMDCIASQISFAEFKGQPDMVFHPAAPEYYGLFAQVRGDKLRSLAQFHHENVSEYQVAGIPIPSAHIIAEHKFALNHE